MSVPGDGVGERSRLDELLAVAARQQTQWRWTDAYDMLRHAVRAARLAGVRDTELSMLDCRRMLAETLRELGHVEQARELVVPLLADCDTYAGPAHPVTVRAAAAAGAILHDVGELDAAEQIYHGLVDTRQPVDGPAARAVMLTRVNLALLHRDRGNLTGALGLLCTVHAEFRRQYGIEDPDAIRISVELADLYRRCGDVNSARRLLTVAHTAARGAFGATHRLTAVVAAELATIEPPVGLPPVAALQRPTEPRATTTTLVRRPPVHSPVTQRRHAAPRPNRSRHLRTVAVAGLATLLAAGTAVVAIGLARHSQLQQGQRSGQDALVAASLVGSVLPDGSGGSRAPGDVQLSDGGDTIVITWTDRSGGVAPAVVAVAPAGKQPTVDGALAAGAARYELRGLDAGQDYCVVVAAYYDTDDLAPSPRVCTRRLN